MGCVHGITEEALMRIKIIVHKGKWVMRKTHLPWETGKLLIGGNLWVCPECGAINA
jgi:hypothetical protein